jgi:hypothetical protein
MPTGRSRVRKKEKKKINSNPPSVAVVSKDLGQENVLEETDRGRTAAGRTNPAPTGDPIDTRLPEAASCVDSDGIRTRSSGEGRNTTETFFLAPEVYPDDRRNM